MVKGVTLFMDIVAALTALDVLPLDLILFVVLGVLSLLFSTDNFGVTLLDTVEINVGVLFLLDNVAAIPFVLFKGVFNGVPFVMDGLGVVSSLVLEDVGVLMDALMLSLPDASVSFFFLPFWLEK